MENRRQERLPCALLARHCSSQRCPLELPRVTRDNWTMRKTGPCDSSPLGKSVIRPVQNPHLQVSRSDPAQSPLQQPGRWEPVPATCRDRSRPPALHPARFGLGKGVLAQDRHTVSLPSIQVCLLGLTPQLPLLPRARASETGGLGPDPCFLPQPQVATHSGGCGEGWLEGRRLEVQ